MSLITVSKATGIFLLVLCLSSAGCVHYATTANRDVTFLPYKDTKVGSESLRKFLIARSAVLLQADQLSIDHADTNSLNFSFVGTKSWVGMAAAIDRRGYFLTAAHCVKGGSCWLMFLNKGKLQAQRARVVWRSNYPKAQPDLAVLQVSLPLQQVFEWAGKPTNETPVLAVGFNYENPKAWKTLCMAGKLLRLSDESAIAPPHYTLISHDVPFRHGDSGGPLVSTDGRLIGINVSMEVGVRWRQLSIEPLYSDTVRPDLEWLRKIIDQDVALQSGAITNRW